MSMLNKFETAKNVLLKDGIASFVNISLRKIFPIGNSVLFWDRFVLVDGPVTMLPPMKLGGEPEYTITEATWQDVCELSFLEYPDQEYKEQVQLERYAAGYKCIIARAGTKIVGYQWLIFADSYITFNLEVTPRQKYAWGCDLYIFPKYRRSGLFIDIMNFRTKLITELGYIGCCATITSNNPISIRTHLRIGMKIYETVDHISLFGLRINLRHGQGYFKPQIRWAPEFVL